MSAFARVEQRDILRRTVEIFVGNESPTSYLVKYSGEGDIVFANGDTESAKPSLTLTNEQAKALLEALSEHYGGVNVNRQLRKDYEAERLRLDRLLERLPLVMECR